MMIFRKSKEINVLIISLFVIVITISCGETPYVPGPEEFPYELMLDHDILPDDWKRLGGSVFEEEDGLSYNVAFGPDIENRSIKISHQLTIYQDEETAIFSYPSWEEKWFNDNWLYPQEIPFTPDDPYRIGNLNVSVNGIHLKSYRYLQRHKNIIVLILANIDGDLFSSIEFEDILEQLDNRLQGFEQVNY